MTSLKVHVQVDRLPDVEVDGAVKVQLGLRLSASIDDAASAAGALHKELVLPWEWKKAGDGAAKWSAHETESWVIWRVRPAAPPPEPPEGGEPPPSTQLTKLDAWKIAISPPVDFDPLPSQAFHARIAGEVRSIVDESGLTRALEMPSGDGTSSARSLFGFVESLTGLPHPVPAGMMVWTAVSLEAADPPFDDHDVFLAAPVFATGGVDYRAKDEAPSLPADGKSQAVLEPTTTAADPLPAEVTIQASLKKSVLEGATIPGRLIDLSRLLVRKNGGDGFEAGDWNADLARRLAEVLDPAARVMAVLDQVVKEETAKDPALRSALAKDLLGGPDRFRDALNHLHRQILAPRALSSRYTAAPAASFLEAVTIHEPAIWPAIAARLLAQTQAEGPKPDQSYSPPETKLSAVSRARLAVAADISVNPDNDLSEDPAAQPIEAEDAFVDWIIRHWLENPNSSAPLNQRSFFATQETYEAGAKALKPIGVIDLMRVRTNDEIAFVLVLGDGSAPLPKPLEFEVSLGPPGFAAPIVVSLSRAEEGITLKVGNQVVTAAATDASTAKLALGIKVSFADDTFVAAELTARYEEKDVRLTSNMIATDVARAGRWGMAVRSSQAISASIESPAIPPSALPSSGSGSGRAQGIRAALSLAAAAGGLDEIFRIKPQQDGGREEWIAAVAETIQTRVGSALDEHLLSQVEAADPLQPLLIALRREAMADAARRGRTLVPPRADTQDRVTANAAPLVFAVDQLQDFDEKEDLWARLAGLGVLISRRGADADPDHAWWSLSHATLHITPSIAANDRGSLGPGNAAKLRSGTDWVASAAVDPAPLVVSELDGVRHALVSYESRSLVAEMASDPRPDAGNNAAVRRRPEAYFFPTSRLKLPPLTFGRRYRVLPYLIGHGGALPVALRANPEDPVTMRATNAVTGSMQIDAPEVEAMVRETPYLRTVAVGLPRLGPKTVWPGPFPGVESLTDELPLRLAPTTIRPNRPARFFRDAEHARGVLDGPADVIGADGKPVEVAAVRFEILGLDVGQASNETIAFQVRSSSAPPSGADGELTPLLERRLADIAAVVAPARKAGLRIELSGTGGTVTILKLHDHEYAEDEPEPVLSSSQSIVLADDAAVSRWRDAYIVLRATGGPVELEPPMLQWGSQLLPQGGGATSTLLQLNGTRPLHPPEIAPSDRKVSVLDGIKPRALGPARTEICLRRPTTSLATFDRWVNGPLGGFGPADKQALIKRAIDAARDEILEGPRSEGDRSPVDPAVEGLVLEVLRVFPNRTVVVAPTMLDSFEDVANALGDAASRDRAFLPIVVAVDTSLAVDAPLSLLNRTLRVAPGAIYELRVFPAIPVAQPYFAAQSATTPIGTVDRFARAATMTWRDVVIDGRSWHLTAPLSLHVEVASEQMHTVALAEAATAPPFRFSLRERPAGNLAGLHLDPAAAQASGQLSSYVKLRSVDRIALLDQRWSWRGRPQPELPTVESISLGFDGSALGTVEQDFLDAAFLGRADDDIGPIREARIGRAHAYGRRERWAGTNVKPLPVVLEKDLDYRGGANLWRFAVRATSRYAAMRPSDPAFVTFSHLPSAKKTGNTTASKVTWWPAIVPDHCLADLTRKISRPALALVLPLTEPMMAPGAVPPLLALFNEAMFPLFHAGDGIEASVEVARHPFTGGERLKPERREEVKRLWAAGEAQLGKVAAAEAAVAEWRRVDAMPLAGQIGDAEAALTASRAALATAMAAFQTEFKAGIVEGRIEALKELRARVAANLAAAPADQRPRLELRLQEIDALLALPPPADPNGEAAPPANPFQKYWTEFSPDPIRTGRGASGAPIAVRVDGPVGYTFDLGVEAGRFDHAGLLITPVAAEARPWSLVKLRFRRSEVPELLAVPPIGLFQTPGSTAAWIRLSAETVPPLSNDKTLSFRTIHEAIVLDIKEVAESDPCTLSLRLSDGTADDPEKVTIAASVATDGFARVLTVATSTGLGEAGTWKLKYEAGATVQLRIVVAPRPKPEDRTLGFRPSADVTVRVRVRREETRDVLSRAHENSWLSVICLPLMARMTMDPAKPVFVLAYDARGAAARIQARPLRLSPFTDGVWCQFAAPMSTVRVHATIGTGTSAREVEELVSVARLRAKAANTTLELDFVDVDDAIQRIGLSSGTEIDAEAQVEERLYAVVTQYVYDAFDRLRERAIRIHRLAGAESTGKTLGAVTWSAADAPATYDKLRGRLRILRVLSGKWLADEEKAFPGDFFGAAVDAARDGAIADEPLDSPGMVLGISEPIEWDTP